MDAQKTKEYLKQIFDLEMTLHTHKEAISAYKRRRQIETPKEPQLIMPQKPNAPTMHSYVRDGRYVEINSDKYMSVGILFAIAGICIFFGTGIGMMGLLMADYELAVERWKLLFGASTLLVVAILCFFVRAKKWKEYTESAKQEDEINKQNYNQQMQKYLDAKKNYDEEIQSKFAVYETSLSMFNSETNMQLNQFNDLLNSLEKCLETLYSQNIVYSKYRNLIAIATIYEYFESGRCCELEGSNGAYNLYENELRANIIIGSLSQITSDIQQIKNGQYALYQELSRSNKLLKSIADNTQLTAYYANVAAVAASADRYIVGMVW